MRPILIAHPFSSYCQKVLVALYERQVDFTCEILNLGDPPARDRLAGLWPFEKFPVLLDAGRTIPEATIIIEHLDLTQPGAPMIPRDPPEALAARKLDRIFDNYVMSPMQRIVADFMRPEDARDPRGVVEARAVLDKAYAWLDAEIAPGGWAAGAAFGLADCAAAPSLFYADWVQPIPERFETLRAYRARLLARPSFARAVDEARPYRGWFPPGAPDRD